MVDSRVPGAPTPAQVAAARLRIGLDRRRNRPTSTPVRKIAEAEPTEARAADPTVTNERVEAAEDLVATARVEATAERSAKALRAIADLTEQRNRLVEATPDAEAALDVILETAIAQVMQTLAPASGDRANAVGYPGPPTPEHPATAEAVGKWAARGLQEGKKLALAVQREDGSLDVEVLDVREIISEPHNVRDGGAQAERSASG